MMTREEVIARMRAADKKIDTTGLNLKSEPVDTFADYWAGSASQQYIDRVKSGDVRTVTVDR